MPKSQYIDPKEMRKAGEITFSPIPVNQYKKTAKEELKSKHFTKDDLKRIYRDMVVIREFETMLQLVKTTGGYNGVEYNNPGPAHLSAGQEAAAVGMAYMLDINDFIFGSHRSHGEILAKGLRAIELLDDKSLEKIMNEFWDGATVNVAKKAYKGGSVKELGIRFLLYGALAEIFARTTGFNKGLGGSMHTFFTPFGIYPNNAIVGGSGSIAVGAALYKKVNRKPGIVVANIGDASMARGPVWEGMTFAAMGPIRTALGRRHERRPAGDHQHHGQPVRHGRTDPRRDDGLRFRSPHRRRREPRADACRTRGRLQSAGRDRRLPPQESDPRRREGRPRAARRADLPLQRPLALGRIVVPHQRGGRSMGGTGFASYRTARN